MLPTNGIRMTDEEIEKMKSLDWDSVAEEMSGGMITCKKCGSILIAEIHPVCYKCGEHV